MGTDIAGSPVVLGYAGIHLLTVGVAVGVAVYTARNYWDKPLGRVFTVLLGTVTIWTAGSLVRLFAPTLDLFVAATTLKYVGIAGAPVTFVVFALLYDGKSRWVRRPVVAAISVLPVLTVPVVATTRLHGLFYSGYARTTVDTISVLSIETVGLWYWLFLGYSWTLVGVGSGLLVHAGIRRSRLYRLQLLVLLPAIGISWATNVLYVVWSWPHPALDPTPIGFAATSLLLGFGLFSTQLVEVSPTARSLVLDVIEEAVIVVDRADRVVDVNSAAGPLLSDPDPVGAELTAVLVADLARQIETETTTVELDDEPASRYYRYRELSEPDRLQGRVLVFTEVTDLRESQRATERAREQLRQIVDLVPDPLFAKNLDDEVLLSNEANAELHGMKAEEIEGKREREIESDVENIENFEKYRQREVEVAETGDPRTFEEELMDPDGETHTFKTTRIPFEATQRDETAVLGYARDVTDLKEYERELEATKDRLERTNEELETLNRILRHDIRNDVAVQSRLGRKLQAHVDEDGREYLEQLLDRSEHIADITTGLRLLMQTMLDDGHDLTAVRLDTILEAEVENVSAAYEAATVSVSDGIPQVSVQADQLLSSVFQNILENAITHNDADRPKVSVSAQEREEDVVVRIADNGPGIPADVADEMFDKGEKGLESKGTGIGLYLVTKLLDRYGGDIRVGSETLRADGPGTTRAERNSVDTRPQATELGGAVFVVTLPKV
jgi:PAS domain S-box-containing protein